MPARATALMVGPKVRHQIGISGMSCAGCAGRIERHLSRLPGLVQVRINVATRRAWLELDPEQLDLAKIAEELKGLGFGLASPSQIVEKPKGQRSLLLAWAGALPLLLGMLWPHGLPLGLQWILASLVFWGAGWPILVKGYRALLGQPSMETLVALGSSAAYLEGSWQVYQGLHHNSLEGCALILAMVLLGRYLEERAKGQAGQALQRLLEWAPKKALLEDGRELEASQLWPGDRVRLLPGAAVPADGQVVEGQSWCDESMLTGESAPVTKRPGDPLVGGTLVGRSPLLMEVQRVGEDTRLAQLARIVEEAQLRSAPIQDLADRVVAKFVPALLGLATLTLLYWLGRGLPQAALAHAISVLVVACPCALGLAVPTALLVGTGRAAQLGLLFRSARALQELGQLQQVWLDKTGTLTLGQLSLVEVQGLTLEPQAALALAVAIEKGSEHPIARALVKALPAGSVEASHWQVIPGWGVRAQVEGVEYSLERCPQPPPAWEELGYTCLSLVGPEGPLAHFALSDSPRPEAVQALRELTQLGLKLGVLSGDSPGAVSHLAAQLGLDSWQAQLSPEDKAQRVSGAVFVGDGLNDAPALASCAVGIAVMGASDLARESAPVVLLRPDLRLLGRAFRLSRRVRANMWQNLGWAFGYNLLLLPWAALGQLPPAAAAGAMALSSLLVVGNSLRLQRA